MILLAEGYIVMLDIWRRLSVERTLQKQVSVSLFQVQVLSGTGY